MSRLSFVALLTLSLVASSCRQNDNPRVVGAIRELTTSVPAFVERGRRGAASWKQVRTFYAKHGHRPVWSTSGRPSAELDALLVSLTQADGHGLDTRSYETPFLEDVRRTGSDGWLGSHFAEERIGEVDVRATYAFLRFAADLAYGRTLPTDIDPKWRSGAPSIDLVETLATALSTHRISETLTDLAPSHPQDLALQQALRDYRQRLATLDRSTTKRGNDESDGWRARQIELNLERWRWMPRDLGSRHILVNIPAYQMQVIQRDRPVLAMRVIVGAPDNPTPVFSDRMTYVVFSPYWNIPEAIMRAETLPRAVANPEYLAEAGIEVVRTMGSDVDPVDPSLVDWSSDLTAQGLRLRQIPGPENALGLVKFVFPNHFNIYLHDTPTGALFDKVTRAFSHGCVRLENPVALAEYVLADQPSWTTDRITAAMHASEESVARLGEPLPVHLGYWTAWVEDGHVHFIADPYQVDRRHARVFEKARRDSSIERIRLARALN